MPRPLLIFFAEMDHEKSVSDGPEEGQEAMGRRAPAEGCVARQRSAGQQGAKGVFVTVGSTQFDELIKACSTQRFRQLLVKQGYSRLTLQIGRGTHIPDISTLVCGLAVSWYRYKSSLKSDMEQASLVISHGGKSLVVVVNEELMGNHQTELADQMATLGVLLRTTHKGLYETMCQLPDTTFSKYESGQPQKLGQEIDRIMGFTA